MAGEFYISDPTGNFDYQPYLDSLRKARTIPIQQLQADQTMMQAKQQALDAVKGKVDALLSPLETLDDSTIYDTLKATVADSSVASATVSEEAVEGSYQLETVDLARANSYRIGSISAIAGIDAPITEDGVLSIAYNKDGVATTLDIAYKDKSLRDIMEQINASDDLNASLVNLGVNGYQLLVTAAQTGVDNAITGIDDTLNSGDDTAGVFSENASNTYETVTARDAKIKLGGIEFTNATNDFGELLTGVSVTAKEIGSTTLTVAKDNSAIQSALENTLNGYNDLVDIVRNATGRGATLAGESSLNSIVNAAFRALSDKLGQYGLLQTEGTADTTKGHLTLDTEAFASFIQRDDAKDILQGFADSLQTRMDGYSTSLNRREQSYQTRMDEIGKRIADMGKRLDSEIETMRMKFVRLQTFMSEMSDVQQRIAQFSSAFTSSANSNS